MASGYVRDDATQWLPVQRSRLGALSAGHAGSRPAKPQGSGVEDRGPVRNTPMLQCDLPSVDCTLAGMPLQSWHVFDPPHRRPSRFTLPSGHLGHWLAPCARSTGPCRDTHLFAGRTSLSPAITSTLFAQTSDRRARSPRDGVCRQLAHMRPMTERLASWKSWHSSVRSLNSTMFDS